MTSTKGYKSFCIKNEVANKIETLRIARGSRSRAALITEVINKEYEALTK